MNGETQMIGWGLDTISKELIWALVVVAVIVAVAVVSLLESKKYYYPCADASLQS